MKKQKIAAIGVLVFALIVAIVMVRINRKPLKEKEEIPATPLRTVEIAPSSQQANIVATANIEATQSLTVTPEIMGTINWISPKAQNGGRVGKGEILIKLDDRDYQLIVQQRQVQVESARLEIDRETARASLASKEWETLGDSADANDLVLRKRQKEVARLNLQSALALLEKAKLDLSRTQIKAPFDAVITGRYSAVGQVVATQSRLLDIVETGELRAELSLSVGDLAHIAIPGIDGAKSGSKVIIRQIVDQKSTIEQSGEVVSIMGALDKQTRRAKVIVSIPESKKGSLGLMPGAFAELTIQGKTVASVIAIPRELISQGEYVWEIKPDSTLNRITLDRLWTTSDLVVAKATTTAPLTLAATLPEGPVNGMKVIPQQGAKPDSTGGAK